MADMESGLKFYSLGIVVADKSPGSDYIQVWPSEDFSSEQGKLGKTNRNYKSELPDINGVKKTATVTGGAHLTAKWLPNGADNRDTSPDVAKGETVKIFRYADTEKYYWTTAMREPELRRREHVRYAYSNQPSGITPYDADTSYFTEISTLEKYIKVKTANNDGEACKYNIHVDTAKGTLIIEDSLDNKIYLDSVAGKMELVVRESIGLKSKRIHLLADDIELNGETVIKKLTTTLPTTTPDVNQGSELIDEFDWS